MAHYFVTCRLCTYTKKKKISEMTGYWFSYSEWYFPLGNNKYMAYLPVKLHFSFFSVMGFTGLALAFHIELHVDINKCFLLVTWFCSKRVTEIIDLYKIRKHLSNIIISHLTVNPQSVAREVFLQLHYCNLSS